MKKIVFLLFVSLSLILFTSSGKKAKFNLDEKIGICSSLSNAPLAKENGLAHMEINISTFLIPEKSDAEFEPNRQAAIASVVPVYSGNGFYPGDIRLTGPDAEIQRAIDYANVAIRRASELGMKVLVLGSSKARNIPEGFDRAAGESQFVEILKGMAPAAEKYGVLIAIEPLQKSETNFINTVREGAAVARKTGSPNICVLADIFHMMRNEEDPGAIIDSADKLVHCHIAEVEERTAPGVKGDDFTAYFRALKKIKYQGHISFECGWQDLPSQLPVAMKTLKQQIESIK